MLWSFAFSSLIAWLGLRLRWCNRMAVASLLDLLRPDLGRKVFDKQVEQKFRHDKVSKEREFSLGEQVLVQNFRGEPRWLEGTVAEQTGPVSYKVLVDDQLWKRHVDQMHKKHAYFMDCTADLGVTAPSRAVNQDNVDVEPTTHPRTETATREPTEAQSSENSSDATYTSATSNPATLSNSRTQSSTAFRI